MKFTSKQLRQIIREVLITEQVVGYQTPSEKEDDKDDEYLDLGELGVDTSSGTSRSTQASAQAVQSLTKQRQQDLDKDDSVAANKDALELNTAREIRG